MPHKPLLRRRNLWSDPESLAKRRHASATPSATPPAFRYDVFVSYCHDNRGPIDRLVGELRVRRESLHVFLDRLELRPGAAWQQHIFEALDASRKVICALSPQYLASKVCKEEFNMALLRHRETDGGVLLPVYLYSGDLPSYMRLIQYEDVREGDGAKMAAAAERLLAQV